MIPVGKRAAVVRALDERGVAHVVTDETSGRENTAVATFPLPTAAVEPVLERLREVGIDERTYTVIVAAETRFEASKTSTRRTPSTAATGSPGSSSVRG